MGALERNPGSGDNWLEKVGGLDPYLEKIAKSIHEKRGKSISDSVQIAWGMIRRWAAGGDNVNPDTQAKAAKAAANMEAKRARYRAMRGADLSSPVDALELAELVDLSTVDLSDDLDRALSADVLDLAYGDRKPPYDWKHGYVPLSPQAQRIRAGQEKSPNRGGRGGSSSPSGSSSGGRGVKRAAAAKKAAAPQRRPKVAGASPAARDAVQRGRATETEKAQVAAADAPTRKSILPEARAPQPVSDYDRQQQAKRDKVAAELAERGRIRRGEQEPKRKPTTPSKTPTIAAVSSTDAVPSRVGESPVRRPREGAVPLGGRTDLEALQAQRREGRAATGRDVGDDPKTLSDSVLDRVANSNAYTPEQQRAAQAEQKRRAAAKAAIPIVPKSREQVARDRAASIDTSPAGRARADAEVAAGDRRAQARAIERKDYANADGPALADEVARRGIMGRERAAGKSDAQLRTALRDHDKNPNASNEDNARGRAASGRDVGDNPATLSDSVLDRVANSNAYSAEQQAAARAEIAKRNGRQTPAGFEPRSRTNTSTEERSVDAARQRARTSSDPGPDATNKSPRELTDAELTAESARLIRAGGPQGGSGPRFDAVQAERKRRIDARTAADSDAQVDGAGGNFTPATVSRMSDAQLERALDRLAEAGDYSSPAFKAVEAEQNRREDRRNELSRRAEGNPRRR